MKMLVFSKAPSGFPYNSPKSLAPCRSLTDSTGERTLAQDCRKVKASGNIQRDKTITIHIASVSRLNI